MTRFAPCLALACLTLSSCSSTDSVVSIDTRAKPPRRVPAALLEPCPKPQRGPLPTVGTIVNRLTYTEGALRRCAAQVDGVRAWDAGNASADAARAAAK